MAATVSTYFLQPERYGGIPVAMDDETVRKVMTELGRRGGLARAKSMTAKERRVSALKASKAAARVRRKKAEKSQR